MPRPSYKTYLNSVGRKPLKLDKLRTVKRAGDVEIFRLPNGQFADDYRHEGEPVSNVMQMPARRVKEEMEDAA